MNKINFLSELIKKKQFDKAKIECEKIIKKEEKNFEFLNIFAIALFSLKEYENSLAKWKLALKINSEYFDGNNNLGSALLGFEKYNDALIYLIKAAEIKSDIYELHHKIGYAYQSLNEIEKALESYNKVLELKSDYLPSIKNKFLLLKKTNKFSEAITELDKLLVFDDDKVKAYIQKGEIYSNLNNSKEAIQNFNQALAIKQDIPFLYGQIINHKLKLCDWLNLEKDLKKLKDDISIKKKTIPPFISTILFDSPLIQLETSMVWTQSFSIKKDDAHTFSQKKNKKIKIGYFSANFRSHADGYLTHRLYDFHDRSKFEVYGFYFGPPQNPEDKLQNKIFNSFDKFVDVSLMDDSQVKKLVKDLNIDIAIDLMGHSGGDLNRFGIFLSRVAPIQICFMGFPCTTGSDTIDYLVADKLIIPEKIQKFYSEKIIYLPDTYQPNEELKKISFQFKSKKDLNLPDNKFIFCCFNGHQKIQPKIFNLWMKILDKRKDSVLWLLRENENSEQNLKKNASKLGIDPNRLIFAKKIQIDKHLARLKFADLFLDTYPYGAHTTCSNALRMNLPVITMKGESFASRVSASILNSINLNELIVDNIEDYEKLALKISNESESLRKIKEKIKKQIELSNLFKPKIFTKNLEKGYLKVYKNYIDGSKPKTIEL